MRPQQMRPSARLQSLIALGRSSGEWRGHRFANPGWVMLTLHTAEMKCAECGRAVHVNARPAPNEVEVGGEAVAIDCPNPPLRIVWVQKHRYYRALSGRRFIHINGVSIWRTLDDVRASAKVQGLVVLKDGTVTPAPRGQHGS